MPVGDKRFLINTILFLIISQIYTAGAGDIKRVDRMEWWREARFGLFIHWGLYAIPAGEWNGETGHAEWIRTTAQIPLDVYDSFIDEFNPIHFNAEKWVRLAKEAGMKYIVITSKHHDGFCLFDSEYTEFDVMSTPFQRDIIGELADACRKDGIRICWYYSIMDWHHPDYLPRRAWEKGRPADKADFNRYLQYIKNQLHELITNYGEIGVLWFDGEWEPTWNRQYGQDLYKYLRDLQPNLIINNRVGAGRNGMEGFSRGEEFAGDFGTPEQQIPATGLPDVDWETCMTMNDHWGYNKYDQNWKSTGELLRILADIASKGGNFLLNVGPTAEGLIPLPASDRLKAMGIWMRINGESIYGTKASPFKYLAWGRCTQKATTNGTRLYLHVFDWPENGKLVVPGILNKVRQARLLRESGEDTLKTYREEDAIVLKVQKSAPDTLITVIVLDIHGKPVIYDPPEIISDFDIFLDEIEVKILSDRENIEIRYTVDGSVPSVRSPLVQDLIRLSESTVLTARCFRDGKAVSAATRKTFTKVSPHAAAGGIFYPGLHCTYFEGKWDSLPDYRSLTPIKESVVANFDLGSREQADYFGFTYLGYIYIPQNGIYEFYTASDDGSRLYIGENLVVDNNGLHGMQEKRGAIPLESGYHPIKVDFFEKTGGENLIVSIKGPRLEKQAVPDSMIFHLQ